MEQSPFCKDEFIYRSYTQVDTRLDTRLDAKVDTKVDKEK